MGVLEVLRTVAMDAVECEEGNGDVYVLSAGSRGAALNVLNLCMLLLRIPLTSTNGLLLFCPGLLTATVASRIHRAAQPALLYLVPFTLLPLLTMAYLKVRETLTICCFFNSLAFIHQC